MTIVIPVWFLWIVGSAAGIALLGLAVVGALTLIALSGGK
jgi:hypothetical protein